MARDKIGWFHSVLKSPSDHDEDDDDDNFKARLYNPMPKTLDNLRSNFLREINLI